MNDPAKGSLFFARLPGSDDFLKGTVQQIKLDGGCGNFFAAAETQSVVRGLRGLYQTQPPWIIPRRHWPDTSSDQLNFSSDPSSDELRAHVTTAQSLASAGQLEHTVECLRMLICMDAKSPNSNPKWLSNFAMQEYLNIISRGISNVVAFIPYEINLGREDPVWQIRKPDDFHHFAQNRRFVAGIIYFPGHWTSFIFDRVGGTLYHCDSHKPGREERFKKLTAFWEDRLTLLDMPYSFNAVQVPCTAQPECWECGYIALTFLHHTLRGLVGEKFNDIKSTYFDITEDVDTSKPEPGKETLPNSQGYRHLSIVLHLRDWAVAKKRNEAAGDCIDRMLANIRAVLYNELGVHSIEKGILAYSPSPIPSWLTVPPAHEAIECPLLDTLTFVGGAVPNSTFDDILAIKVPKTSRVFVANQGNKNQLVPKFGNHTLEDFVPSDTFSPHTKDTRCNLPPNNEGKQLSIESKAFDDKQALNETQPADTDDGVGPQAIDDDLGGEVDLDMYSSSDEEVHNDTRATCHDVWSSDTPLKASSQKIDSTSTNSSTPIEHTVPSLKGSGLPSTDVHHATAYHEQGAESGFFNDEMQTLEYAATVEMATAAAISGKSPLSSEKAVVSDASSSTHTPEPATEKGVAENTEAQPVIMCEKIFLQTNRLIFYRLWGTPAR